MADISPAPWRIEQSADGFNFTMSADGRFVTNEVSHDSDACLIAAAPELYEALHNTLAILRAFVTPETDAIARVVVDQAEAALRRARGEG